MDGASGWELTLKWFQKKVICDFFFKVKNKENPLRSLANLVSKSGSAT